MWISDEGGSKDGEVPRKAIITQDYISSIIFSRFGSSDH